MFSSPKSDQAMIIQQCLANYDYSNATLLAEELLFKQDSEENKGLLADCYLAQQENQKAYFLLKNSTSSLNAYKFAVACIRLNITTEAETALTSVRSLSGDNIPNEAFGLQLLGNVYEKQNDIPKAKMYYERALGSNPKLLGLQKKLTELSQGFHDIKPETIEEGKQTKEAVQVSSNQPISGVASGGQERPGGLFSSLNKPQGSGLFGGSAEGIIGLGSGSQERPGRLFTGKFGDKTQGGGLFGGSGGLFGSGGGTQGKSGGLFSGVKAEEKSPYEIIDSASLGKAKKAKGKN